MTGALEGTAVPADADSRLARLAGRPLTAREVQVLDRVSRGWPPARIARELRISPFTVERHVERLRAKLGVSNRAGLVGEGFRLGLLSPQPTRPLDPALAETLPLIAAGLSDGEIAVLVFRSLHTVRSRVHRLLLLLGASSRHEAVRVAVEAGYLRLSPNREWVVL